MKKLGKYSFGLGDRFGHQGEAQLRAIIEAERKGVLITPVWNKSNREHITIGTKPEDVRKEADAATAVSGFERDYYVDADHINLDTVDRFIDSSDFFTIDVASYIGKKAEDEEIRAVSASAAAYSGELRIPGLDKALHVTMDQIGSIAEKYLFAAIKAGEIYSTIEKTKGSGNFVTEVSMDEVPAPQTPVELFFILMMLSLRNIPVQTIAPKFTGRFNKGVDYSGNPDAFAAEFEADLLVIAHAVKEFGLPGNLKMSVHSGSDKFAIYPHIGALIRKHGSGIHVKTAGTTWLEEVIGLAASGGKALQFTKELYSEALLHIEELCAPYADVIDIRTDRLPSAAEAGKWTAERFAAAITHDSSSGDYNPDMRQLLHVAYKIAAHRMDEYYSLLDIHREKVAGCVFENIYRRHLCRLFDLE